jgi:FKBP-type peptidyl-prolyl cis-trans isomerase
VIPGFSQGTTGMKVGGLRRVVVPPNLGYGAAGSPPDIPGNATLIFEIELIAVQ